MKLNILNRLEGSRTGQKLLHEIDVEEKKEAAWHEAAEELRELRRNKPEIVKSLQAECDRTNDSVRAARAALRLAEDQSCSADCRLHSELFKLEKRIGELEAVCYRTAPPDLLATLDGLREKLLDNFQTSEISSPAVSVDLRRRRILHDRSAVNEHLQKRKELEAAIAEIEAQILSAET